MMNLQPTEGRPPADPMQDGPFMKLHDLGKELNAQRSNETELCDISFKLGKEIVWAHQSVLFTRSPYIDNLLLHKELKKIEVEIQGLNAKAFSEVIQFFYTSEMCINRHNVEEILPVACFLQVADVKKHCESILKQSMNIHNVSRIWRLASQLKCEELIAHAFKYATANFIRLAQANEFVQLDLKQLADVISHPGFFIEVEQDLYTSVMKWVTYDVTTREVHLKELLDCVRFPLLGLQFVEKTVENDDLIQKSHVLTKIVQESKADMKLFESQLKPNSSLVFTGLLNNCLN